jgi:hypothetical protein
MRGNAGPSIAVMLQLRSDMALRRARSFIAMHRVTIGVILLLLLSAWCISSWSSTIQRIVRYYTAVPYLDYWITTARLPAYRAFDIRVYWQQDNEHRIFFPQIVYAADYMLLHGRRLIPLVVSFLSYFGTWVILNWAFWSSRDTPRFLRYSGMLLSGIVMGWPGSVVILASPIELQRTLTQISSTFSLAFLSRLATTGRTAYLTLTVTFAVIASYSCANGLMLWPLLVGAALLLSLRIRHIIALICAAAICISVFFISYQSMGTLAVRNLILHPIYLLGFLASYLSLPFGFVDSFRVSVCVGLANLLLFAVLGVLSIRKRLLYSCTGIVLFGSYLFAVLTCILIAAGRMQVSDTQFSSAKAERYLVGPLVAWSALLLLCLWIFSWLDRRGVAGYLAAISSVIFLLYGFSQLKLWLKDQDKTFSRLQLAEVAVEMNVFDPGVMLNLFPWNPGYVELCSKILREGHLSVFYKGYSNWLGHPVRAFAEPLSSFAHGEITYSYPVLGGVEVAGWVEDSHEPGDKGWVLLSSESGQIVGFGRRLPAGYPDELGNPETPASLGWVGFINLRYPVEKITCYLITKRGLLPFPRSVPMPELQVVARKYAGHALENVRWQMDSGWAQGEPPETVPYGAGPATPIYNSWSGNDAHVGRIASSIFSAPSDGCLILPVLQGYHSGGLSAELTDADSNELLASIPFQDGPKQWMFWRVSFAPSVRHLRITAEDNGRNWGEWMALGAPSSCLPR